MRRLSLVFLAAFTLAGTLAGCADWIGPDYQPPLPGDRISVLTHDTQLQPDMGMEGVEIRLPRPQKNTDWPQSGGYAHHAMHHLAIDGNLTRIWSNDIGSGSSDVNRILSQPIVAQGLAYAIDTEASVTAMSMANGREQWSVDLRPDAEDDGESLMGGGLAYADGMVFVTTGFAEVIALDAGTGQTLWRKKLTAPMRAAPAVKGGRVFVVTVDNQIQALAAQDGKILWSYAGIVEVSSLLGSAAPAVDSGVVVAGLSSGELLALRVSNGGVVWQDVLSAQSRTDGVSEITDIPGRPVIDRGQVFATGHGGLTVAIDLRTGMRLWEAEIGGTQQPWLAGGYIYLLTNNAELVALDRKTGQVLWVNALPHWEDPEDRTGLINWTGPVLVSDRLIVVDSNGQALAVSPYSGKSLGVQEMPAGVHVSPIIADGAVVFLTEDADVVAFR